MSLFKRKIRSDGTEDQGWFYCNKHNRVEHDELCRAIDRLGPYPDEATASHALELARLRTEEQDRKDRSWGSDED
jgi:hypothetical protein